MALLLSEAMGQYRKPGKQFPEWSKVDFLGLLLHDVQEWNKHRKKYSSFQPNLSKVDLKRAKLKGADLSRTNLIEADLIVADLRNANLNDADLSRSRLGGANLCGASLKNADLILANLAATNLTSSDLSSADLRGAILIGAYLSGARLNETVFASSNLLDATFEVENINTAIITQDTIFSFKDKLDLMILLGNRKAIQARMSNSPTAFFKPLAGLRTAFKQYFNYLNDFLISTKGVDIGLEVFNSVDGIVLEITKPGHFNLDAVNQYIQEYLGYLKTRLDKLKVNFEIEADQAQIMLTQVELRGQIRNLRQAVEIRNVKIEYLERMVDEKDKYLTLFSKQKHSLQVVNQTSSMSSAHSTANATSTLSLELPKLQEALADVRETTDTAPLKEAQEALDKLPSNASEEAVHTCGALPKIKRFLDKVAKAHGMGEKILDGTKKTIRGVQKLAFNYNQIAQLCGAPLVPNFLLGKSEEKK